MTKSIAVLISGLCYFEGGAVGLSMFQMKALMTFLAENYSNACAEYVRSAFDKDEEDEKWYAHMDPGGALLDWIEHPTILTTDGKIAG